MASLVVMHCHNHFMRLCLANQAQLCSRLSHGNIHISSVNLITLMSINTDTNTGIDIIDIWVDTPTDTVDLQKFQYLSSL